MNRKIDTVLTVWCLGATVLFGAASVGAAANEGGSVCDQDSAGPFSINYFTPKADKLEIEATIREFIWSHWRTHQTGSVKATWYSLEGAPTRVEYLIGPDANGQWWVSVESEYTEPRDDSLREPHVTRRSVRAKDLERRALLDDGTVGEIIKSDVVMPAGRYKLVLLDADGAVVERL